MANQLMTRREFREHKCYKDLRAVEKKYEDREYRLKKIVGAYANKCQFEGE